MLEDGDASDPANIDFRSGLPVVEPRLGGHGADKPFPRTVWYKAVVQLDGVPGRMGLVLERSAIQGDFRLYCNGIPCDHGVPSREYDCNNIEYPLTREQLQTNRCHFYRKDEVVVALRVLLNKPGDGLLEPIRLFGDFTAELNGGESLGAVLTAASWPVALNTGSWAHQGFPHFSGRMLYEQDVWVEPGSDARRCTLRIAGARGSVEALVNGQTVGIAAWEPYAFDVGGLLRAGNNRIGLAVANTLEPLLYGNGKPSGVLGPAFIDFYD